MPSLHTRTGEFGGKSWIISILGLFCIFNVSATYYSAYSLQISIMAFFTAFAHYITVGEGISSLAICRYAPNTNKIGTRPFKPAVSLRALNAIYRVISLLIPSSSTAIIW